MAEKKVASIMVTYNPESDLVNNAYSIADQALSLLIIDNGSNSESLKYLKTLEDYPNITIIYNGVNKGLGTALNQGIRYFLDNHLYNEIEWIATFDQDSKIEEDYFQRMLDSYAQLPNQDVVAILAPNWVDQKLINVKEHPISTSDTVEQTTVITSGSLTKKNVFNEIGLFIEDYFIDFLDIEFCLRARRSGFKIMMVQSVSMVHNLGNSEIHQLFRSNVTATNHNYVRRYYITRNRIHTYKKYYKFEKTWLKQDMIATIKEFIILLLFEKDRVKKLKSTIKGTVHGITGKTGKGSF